MNKRQIASWKKKIEKRRDEVGKMRDKLRDDMDEMDMLKECCDRAVENMDAAIDALSELA
jgi:hypothetical protein